MRTFDTNEKDLSKIEGKSETRKVPIFLVKLSSKLFTCLVCEMYNKVQGAQKRTSHVKIIHSWDWFMNRPKEIYFEKLANELHDFT